MATGPLSAPNTPAFEGLATFAGEVLHSAQWPHEPVDFTGRRVAVVGTGTSAVQIIPTIAPQTKSLTVFQRTAAYVVPSHNGPLDPAHEARIKCNYAGHRARNRQMRIGFNSEIPTASRSALEASADEREATFEERWRIGGFAFLGAFADLMTNLDANALAAEFVRGKIREIVADPATAELLCPRQPIGCKRMAVDSVGDYAAFNRPNVRLVDVSQHLIETVTPRGLVTGGREYEFDTLVLATGFDAVTGVLKRMDLRGRRGLSIRDKWRDPAELPRTGDGRFSESLQGRRRRQHERVHLRHSVDRAPHRLDCRLHRLARRPWCQHDRGNRESQNRLDRVRSLGRDADRIPQLRLLVPRRQRPWQTTSFHAARERLPDVCGALRGGGARGLHGLCLRVNGFDKSGSPSPGRGERDRRAS